MTLTKAIELLQCPMPPYTRENDPDTYAAIKLGIEAMKDVQHRRKSFLPQTYLPLPGETPED